MATDAPPIDLREWLMAVARDRAVRYNTTCVAIGVYLHLTHNPRGRPTRGVHGQTFVGAPALAERLGLHVTTVQGCLKELENRGFLLNLGCVRCGGERPCRGGRGHSRRRQATIPGQHCRICGGELLEGRCPWDRGKGCRKPA